MFIILYYIFIYLLTVYGAVSLISILIKSVRQRADNKNPGIKLALLVKNQSETIEGVIQNIFIKDFLGEILSDGKLIVVDMGSEDETVDILEKIKKDYVNIDILRENEKEKLFTYIE